MDHVRAVADGQAHRVIAERVVRPRLHDLRNRIPVHLVFLANRLGRIPHGMLLLGHHVRLAQRSVPVHLPDADREGDDDRLLVLFRLRIIVEPMFRKIDDDTVTRSRRENALSGQQDVPAVTGNPHIGSRIGADDFLVPEAVAPGDVEQRVLVGRLDVLIGAHDGAAVLRQLVNGPPDRGAGQHCGHAEEERSQVDVHYRICMHLYEKTHNKFLSARAIQAALRTL